MIRIDRNKDGEIRLIVQGEVTPLPEKGQTLVIKPETEYGSHIEKTDDRTWETT